jgi:two-component system response regulator VicR
VATVAHECEKLLAFEHGADDFLTEPVSARELAARIRVNVPSDPAIPAAGRRSVPFRFGPLTLDPGAHTVSKNGVVKDLTAAEFTILEYLILQAGVPLSSEQLYAKLPRGLVGGPSSIRMIVHRLRQKVEDDPTAPTLLVNVRGQGLALRRTPEVSS